MTACKACAQHKFLKCRICRRKAGKARRSKKLRISLKTFVLVLIVTVALGMVMSVGTDSGRPEHAQWVSR